MAELKIKADSGGGTVSLKGPATTTSNAAVQLTLPVDDGAANQYLKTDGSGALSWATVTDTTVGGATGVDFNDNVKARFGTGNDLEIYHDGSQSRIVDTGTGNLCLQTTTLNIYNPGSTETMGEFIENGAVKLYYDNAKKFETTSAGTDVTGNCRIHSTGNNPSCEILQQTDGNYSVLNLKNSYTTSGKKMINFIDDGGNVRGSCVIDGTNTTYNTSSDYRLKENEVLISDGITRLKLLKPYRFNWKENPSKTQDGFFAHEVTPAVPEAVWNEKDMDPGEGGVNYQALDYSKLVPLLTAALQEAITKIETLETKVAALEAG